MSVGQEPDREAFRGSSVKYTRLDLGSFPAPSFYILITMHILASPRAWGYGHGFLEEAKFARI